MDRKLMFSNVNNAWCTPQDFFDKVNVEFNFTLDPCATQKSAKCKKFFTAIEDGLKHTIIITRYSARSILISRVLNIYQVPL